jgi:drug/metabolite transporter (DMT)-like permease
MAMSRRGWFAFVALSIVWGIPYLLIKVAVREISFVDVAWCDVALGAVILLPFGAIRGEIGALGGRWRAIAALALLQLALPSLLIAASERWIRSSLAGTLAATVPLLVVPLAPLFGVHESLDARRAAGLLVGFAGVVVLLGLGAPKDLYEWIGIGCMLLAALAYAIAPLIIERHLKDRQDLGSAAASLGVAVVILTPAVIWSMPTSLPSLGVLGSLVVLGMVSTGLGLALYFFLIREVGAARASVVTYFKPAIAAVLGAVVLHESFPLSSRVGLLMIILGSWMATHVSASACSRAVAEAGPTQARYDKQCNERRARMNNDRTIRAVGQTQTEPRTRARAQAKITVQSSETRPYDQTASPALMAICLSETFAGDIDGESTVRALQVLRDDRSASMVSVQRFRGRLGGRHGTFVLQGSEIVESGKIRATWFTVPGSGTGDLAGLRGEGGFEGYFGKGSDGTLEYWFE